MIASRPTRPSTLDLLVNEPPAAGSLTALSESLLWLRLQLPFRLNHVNLWLIKDDAGWAVIDTGLGNEATQGIWGQIIVNQLGAPLTRVIVTHYHPDHMGNAGWLTRTYGVPFHAPLTEWSYGKMLSLMPGADYQPTISAYYARFGLSEPEVKAMEDYGNHYARHVSPLPHTLNRLMHGDTLTLGSSRWQVMTFGGHAPEHACFYNAADNIFIAGDQVLPFISPNISVSFFEPEADPLSHYYASLKTLREQLPAQCLVLPCHGLPFRNLHVRLDELARHHDERLEQVRQLCATAPQSAAMLMRSLFPQELDRHQIMFAIGEAAAHANHLVVKGQLKKEERAGVLYYAAA